MTVEISDEEFEERRHNKPMFEPKLLVALAPYIVAACSAFFLHEQKIISLKVQVEHLKENAEIFLETFDNIKDDISRLEIQVQTEIKIRDTLLKMHQEDKKEEER